jgi:hypothetical protein
MRAEADKEEIISHVLPETGATPAADIESNPVVKAVKTLISARGGK